MKWPLFNLITSALVRSVMLRENEQNWKNEMAESLFNHVANSVPHRAAQPPLSIQHEGKVQSVQLWGAQRTLPLRLHLDQWACWLDSDVRKSRGMNLYLCKGEKKGQNDILMPQMTLFLMLRWLLSFFFISVATESTQLFIHVQYVKFTSMFCPVLVCSADTFFFHIWKKKTNQNNFDITDSAGSF